MESYASHQGAIAWMDEKRKEIIAVWLKKVFIRLFFLFFWIYWTFHDIVSDILNSQIESPKF